MPDVCHPFNESSTAVAVGVTSEQVAANERRALKLVVAFGAGVALVVFVVLVLFNLIVAVVAAIVAGVAAATSASRRSDAAVLTSIGASLCTADEEPRLHNLIDGLCVASGVTKPAVLVVDDDAANACVVGRHPRRAALVVTRGLLTSLERIELEAVIAHELSRLKSADTVPGTVAVTTVGLPLFLSERALRTPAANVPPPGAVTALAGRLCVLVAPISARALRRWLGETDPVADFDGVALTRYPPGLIAALEKLRDRGTIVAAAVAATDHLWLAPASSNEGGGTPARLARLVRVHPPLEERIEALREL